MMKAFIEFLYYAGFGLFLSGMLSGFAEGGLDNAGAFYLGASFLSGFGLLFIMFAAIFDLATGHYKNR